MLKPHPVQHLHNNILLYNLSLIHGAEALIGRIEENTGGVYALFRNFIFPPDVDSDPEIFTSFVRGELAKEHSALRETRLPPAHRIGLKSDVKFYKDSELREQAKDPLFRSLILTLLENALFFQQPLYIGKAVNFRNRIATHLELNSRLRRRLGDAGHNIDICRLLIVPLPTEQLSEYFSEDESEELEQDSSVPESFQNVSEILIEDILSRLFLPSFTLRYG